MTPPILTTAVLLFSLVALFMHNVRLHDKACLVYDDSHNKTLGIRGHLLI